jgi:hypothetical protein
MQFREQLRRPHHQETVRLRNVTEPQTMNVSYPLGGKHMLKMSNKKVLETVAQVGKQVQDNQENYATRIIICTSFEKSVREGKHLPQIWFRK